MALTQLSPNLAVDEHGTLWTCTEFPAGNALFLGDQHAAITWTGFSAQIRRNGIEGDGDAPATYAKDGEAASLDITTLPSEGIAYNSWPAGVAGQPLGQQIQRWSIEPYFGAIFQHVPIPNVVTGGFDTWFALPKVPNGSGIVYVTETPGDPNHGTLKMDYLNSVGDRVTIQMGEF